VKKVLITTCSMTVLAACSPEPIFNYDVPYEGKFSAPEQSIRPEPKPEGSNVIAMMCPKAWIPGECDSEGNDDSGPDDGSDSPRDPETFNEEPTYPGDEPVTPDHPKGNNGEDPQLPGNPPGRNTNPA